MARGPHGREKGVRYEQIRRGGIPDPYIPSKGHKEPTVCPVCKVVYHKKRWLWDDKLLKTAKADKDVSYTKCPACRKIEDKFALGKVYLSGSFVLEHFEELINLLKSEERHAMEKNPLERLMKLEKNGDGIYAETTSDALAMRIGHVLQRAYKGDEDFNFRAGDKFLEIKWHRD
ncbi:BCAM0308 family protein [Candidatus Margulisiibacteriota bacterium]